MKKIILLLLLLALGLYGGWRLYLRRSINRSSHVVYVFVRQGESVDAVAAKLRRVCYGDVATFKKLALERGYTPRSGRYAIAPGATWKSLLADLAAGRQEPVKLTLRSERDLSRWAAEATASLMVPHEELLDSLRSPTCTARLGFTPQTVYALLVPGTYEVLWDTSADHLLRQLLNAYQQIWDDGRLALARDIPLTPREVETLASCLHQETNYDDEKPRMAGVYINRLRQGMRLQLDPTVLFALEAWDARRVTQKMTRVDSPYNTYRHAGLPPGPICIPTVADIDAVLHYERHDFLYYVAKADLRGHHVFARTYDEHQANARRYVEAIEKRR